MSITKRLTAASSVLIATMLFAAPAFAKTVTQSATAALSTGGTVNATISYTRKAYYDADIQLTITRNGQQLLSKQIGAAGCGTTCSVEPGYTTTGKSIHVVDVQGSGEPEVFVDLYTGGAHCCSITNFYTYDAATQSYRAYEYTWGDPGYRLKLMGGKYVFETDNDAFAYEFTDYAASGLPLQLFSFNGTQLVNITLQYPKLIAKDAASYLAAYKSQSKDKWSDTVGVIAAWAADEDELGNSAMVATYLQAQAAAGHLNSPLRPYEVGGTKFITKLNAFLKKEGYLS